MTTHNNRPLAEAAGAKLSLDKVSVTSRSDRKTEAEPPPTTALARSSAVAVADLRTTRLYVPSIVPDTSTIDAALAYAQAGWYVLPVNPRDKKNPGSRVGKGWPAKSSRDTEQIVAWFAGTNDLLALHAGRSGAVVFDVDEPAALPEVLKEELWPAHVPYQSTRKQTPGRGHYPFLMPRGRTLGNSKGGLPGAWGEVRGRNGVIIVAPSEHEQAAEGGRYLWDRTGPVPALPEAIATLMNDAQSTEDAATDAEVVAFLAEHTTASRPELLKGKVVGWTAKLDAGESRHETACGFVVGALKEARAGFYRADVARDTLRELFVSRATSDKPGDPNATKRTVRAAELEFDGIAAWAVAQANAADLDAVRDRVATAVPPRPGLTPWSGSHLPTLEQLLAVLRQYQHVDDPGHILIALAVGATRDLDDEPCWLLFVAPPSSGKTETVRLLDDIADARLNEVTAPGLLTWGRGKSPKPTGILADLTGPALLTFGDLSSLLATSDRGGRDQVFGLLRRVYDGEASRDIAPPQGAAPGGRLVWNGRATVVAAVTGAIDAYTSHADALGPRWVYYRLAERSTAEKRAAARMARRGGLAEPRGEARSLAAGIVQVAQKLVGNIEVPENIAEWIEDAALVGCWGRAAVPRNGYGKREIDGVAMVEEPPRLIRQLLVLARGLLALRIDEETTIALVRRVALDSMPATRRAVLQVLGSGEMNLTTAKVAGAAGLERGVARRTLEELEVIGIVAGRRAGPEPEEHETDRRSCTWSLTGEDGQLVAAVLSDAHRARSRCAEMWGPPTQPPRNRDRGTDPAHVSAHVHAAS